MVEGGFCCKYQNTFTALITLRNSKGFSFVPGTGTKTKYIFLIINYNITLVLTGKASKSRGEVHVGVLNLKER